LSGNDHVLWTKYGLKRLTNPEGPIKRYLREHTNVKKPLMECCFMEGFEDEPEEDYHSSDEE
jgi:hypothetical protein